MEHDLRSALRGRRERGRGRVHGKSQGPDGAPPRLKEGADADEALDQSRRSSLPRRQLERHDRFEEVSPEVGELDEEAFDDAMSVNPDEALSMLADMARATDRGLRELARRLAGRLMVDVARHGPVRQRGVGRMATTRFDPDAGDLDVDASIDAIVEARAAASAIDPDGLRVRRWVRPRTAICLLLDRSGSMSGKPLATNAVAAAAVAQRSKDFSVISFAKDGLSIKSQEATMQVELVVDRILGLRGRGSTDVAGALDLAAQQLMRSTAGRKVTILLSDCRATEHGDVVGAARRLDELVILAPRGDDEAARELARETGSRIASITGPTDVPAAIAELLG